MNETKLAIGALCQHLNFILGTDLRPEHFRLAKFDKTDENVVNVFWNLLEKFLQEQMTLSTVDSVKLFLHDLKYESLPFFCLPDNMSCGSRELLLALGFLLGRDVLERIVEEHLRKTTDFNLLPDVGVNKIDFDSTKLKMPSDKIRAIAWMKGRIKLNQRMINELDLQNKELLVKVNRHVIIANVSELSFNEIIALKKKNYGEEFLKKTDFIISLLENHQRWIKKQHIFWRWMNSVLTERVKDHREKTIELQYLKNFSAIIKNNSN